MHSNVSSRMLPATIARERDTFEGLAVLDSKVRRYQEACKVKHLEEDTNLTTTTTGLVVHGNVENEYELFRIESSIQGRKPYQVQLALNGKIIPMEVDTGASRTVVSKKTYEAQFAKLEMKKANIVLKTYNGDPLKVLGY